MATMLAAEKAAIQVREVAARMLNKDEGPESVAADDLVLRNRAAYAPDGRSVSHREIALYSLHAEDQHQIMATASYVSPEASPPPFAAQFVTVTVDTQTGQITVNEMVMAVDSGVIVNPITASGQIEGGMIQALGYGHCEEMTFDAHGRMVNPAFGPYKIYRADEMPQMGVIFIETYEPTGPFGAKAVAEIPLDGAGPALANAVYDAVGVQIRNAPLLPEKVWRALKGRA
jgi:putative selenate reductase molybdopterin-binding subunit